MNSRRAFLCGVGSSVAVAGCTGLTSDSDDEEPTVSGGMDYQDDQPTTDTETGSDSESVDEIPGQWTGSRGDITHHQGYVDGNPVTDEPASEVWEFDAGSEVGTPALVDETIYVNTSGAHFFAVDALSGEEKWRYDTRSSAPTVPPDITVAVDGDTVFGCKQSGLFALSTESGERHWNRPGDLGVDGGIAVGDELVFASSSSGVEAFEKETGDTAWLGETDATANAPAYDGTNVYAGFVGDSGSDVGHIVAWDASTGEEVWRSSLESAESIFSPVMVYNGQLFVCKGEPLDMRVFAVDPSNGDVNWSFYTGGAYSSRFAIVDEHVYVAGEDGNLYAVEIDSGNIDWNTPVGTSTVFGPTVIGDTLYASSEGSIVALNRMDGSVQWELEINSESNWWYGVGWESGFVAFGGEKIRLYTTGA